MGTVFDMQAFYRWLETASGRELLARRDGLVSLRASLTEAEVKADATRYLRLIEDEMLARSLRA